MQEFKCSTFYRSLWEKEKRLFETLKADCFVPLLSEDVLVGILVLPEQKDHVEYRENDLNTVRTISAICAQAVKDAYVYECASAKLLTENLVSEIREINSRSGYGEFFVLPILLTR